jgi:Flp pilus assembly protein TadD
MRIVSLKGILFAIAITNIGIVPLLTATGLSIDAQTDNRRLQIGKTKDENRNQPGRYYALVIGNNDYPYLSPLKTAVTDAEDVAGILRNKFGFQINLLRNATRDQILTALYEYRRTLTESTNLLVYYAGHGHYDRDVDKAYWLPVDARRDNNVKWISADDVTTNIKGISAKHILIISDSCYSGMIPRDGTLTLTPLERERYLQKMIEGTSRILISSGGNEPVADDGGTGHSVFARALLRGFEQVGDDVFTAEELFYQFIRESVAGKSDQTPQYSPIRNSGHENGDFVFVRRKDSIVNVQPAITAEQHIKYGDELVDEGKFAEAEAEYRQALRLAPQGALGHAKLGDVLSAQKKYTEAQAEYEQVTEQKKWPEIEVEYRRALRQEPERAWRHRDLGVALGRQLKYVEAEAEYIEAVRLEPNNARWRASLGTASAQQKKFAEAETQLNEAVRLEPNSARYCGELGTILTQLQKHGEAELLFKKAVRLEPNNDLWHGSLGRALEEQKKWQEAEVEYRYAMHLDPKKARWHSGLGWSLHNQQKWLEAEPEFREAVRLEPNNAQWHTNLGVALDRQKKWVEAEVEYRVALRLEPNNAQWHYNVGIALYNQNKWADAEPEYREALRLKPNNALWHDDLGKTLGNQKKWSEAEVEAREAVRLDPNNARYHNDLGLSLSGLQKLAEAEQQYREALRLEPKNAGGHANLGRALGRKKKWSEAEVEAREAVRLDPNNARYHNDLAVALASLQKFAEAEQEYREAVRLDPKNSEFQEALKRVSERVSAEPKALSSRNAPAGIDIAGTYTGTWISDKHNLQGSLVMSVVAVAVGQFEAKITLNGSDYIREETLIVKVTPVEPGVCKMEYTGKVTGITGTGLFKNGRFMGDYRFMNDSGKWNLQR